MRVLGNIKRVSENGLIVLGNNLKVIENTYRVVGNSTSVLGKEYEFFAGSDLKEQIKNRIWEYK